MPAVPICAASPLTACFHRYSAHIPHITKFFLAVADREFNGEVLLKAGQPRAGGW